MRHPMVAAGLMAVLVLTTSRSCAKERRHPQDVSPRQSAERLDPRGSDQLDGHPLHGRVQQPRALRPEQAAEQPRRHRARPRQVVELERRRQGPHLQAAGRREVARRQAVHREGRRLHLRPPDRARARTELRTQPAQTLVPQRRATSRPTATYEVDLAPRPAAALDAVDARLGLFADLSLPRARRRRCAPSRSAPARSSSSSSSATSASSSRAITDYWKKGKPYLDGIDFTIVPNRGTAMLSFKSGRFDIVYPWEVTIPLLKDMKQQMPDAQLCQTTSMNNSTNLLLNRDAPPFDNPDLRRGAEARHRPQGLHRHPQPGRRAAGRRHAAAARRRLGPADGDVRRSAGLRAGRREEPRAGARADEESGLRARQAAAAQDLDARHLALQGPGGDPGRPAQGDLDRRRRRDRRDRAVVSQDRARRTIRSASTPPATASTIPTRTSTRTSPASRSATTPATAIPRSRRCSTQQSVGARPREAQEARLGDRHASCSRTTRGRSSCGTAPRPACSPTSRATSPHVNSVYNGFRFEDVWLDR